MDFQRPATGCSSDPSILTWLVGFAGEPRACQAKLVSYLWGFVEFCSHIVAGASG